MKRSCYEIIAEMLQVANRGEKDANHVSINAAHACTSIKYLIQTILFLVDLTSPSINDNLVNPVAIGLTLAFFEIAVMIFMTVRLG